MRAALTLLGAVWLAVGVPALALGGDEAAPAEAAPEAAAVAPTEHPALDGHKLGLQILNFSVLIAILFFAGRGAIKKALVDRHQELKTELAAAAEARVAAEARLERQERRLAALEQEIAAIRAGIKQEAEMEKARLIELAEDRARRIREETSFLLDQQVKQAEEDLRREAGRAAVELAEQLVRAAFNAGDQQRLVDAFVGDVAPDSRPRSVS